MELGEIIELKTAQVQEQSGFLSGVLKNLMDEGSTVTHSNGVTLYLPAEKLTYIFEELRELAENVDKIDALISIENEFS